MKESSLLPRGTTLSAYVSEKIESLSKSQKDVAQYIVDHLDEVAFQTAEELAKRVSTSSSTVVRLSQALGFEGFPELQQAAREEYRSEVKGGGKDAKKLLSLEQSEFESALLTDHVNVEETAVKIEIDKVQATSRAIVKAGRIMAIGLDQMSFFAGYMRYLFGLLGLNVEIVTSPTRDALAKVANIDQRTLVIGFVAGRPDPLLVRALKLAKHRKGVAVSLVDATLSDVSKHSHISFYYSSNSPSYVRSHTALLSFIQALAYSVYAQDPKSFENQIKTTRPK